MYLFLCPSLESRKTINCLDNRMVRLSQPNRSEMGALSPGIMEVRTQTNDVRAIERTWETVSGKV